MMTHTPPTPTAGIDEAKLVELERDLRQSLDPFVRPGMPVTTVLGLIAAVREGWKAREEREQAEAVAELAIQKRDEAEAEVERLQTALRRTAEQHTSDELDEMAFDNADFVSGFDACVVAARTALEPTP